MKGEFVMKSEFVHHSRIAACVCFTGLLFVCFAADALAQDSQSEAQAQHFAPPPFRYVPENEQAQLTALTRDRRARTRLCLELAAARIERAEQSTAAGQHADAVAQLGIYQALIEDSIRFLNSEGQNDGRSRDIYRRFEQTLRGHSLRIEAVRRITPVEYAVNVQTIIDFAQQARTSALNAFFGGAFASDDLTSTPTNSSANGANERAPSVP